MRKIGVLTSGGDSPGMNAAVMSVARSAALYGIPLIGIKRGYNGLLRKSANIKDDLQELNLETVLDIADEPGTYLRTARCDEFRQEKYDVRVVLSIGNSQGSPESYQELFNLISEADKALYVTKQRTHSFEYGGHDRRKAREE